MDFFCLVAEWFELELSEAVFELAGVEFFRFACPAKSFPGKGLVEGDAERIDVAGR